MSAPQHEPSSVDLSGSRWREARARGATVNLVAPHELKPRAGQLAGSGNDRLYLAIHYRPLPVGDDVPAHVPLGDRGPLLALLDWAKGRGVRTAPAFEALSRSVPPRPVPLLAFHQMIVDVQRECAVSGQTAWGLFPSDRANEPVRVLLPTEPATTLLATPTAAVGVSSTGLHLLRRHITLTGWRHTERGLLLTTPDGQRRLGPASLSAQLLSWVGRGAPQIDLRRVSLIALLTPILDNSLVDLATGYVATIDNRMGEQALIGVDPDIIRRPRRSTFRRRHWPRA